MAWERQSEAGIERDAMHGRERDAWHGREIHGVGEIV